VFFARFLPFKALGSIHFADYPSEQENSLASVDKFCGAWESEKSTEEIASEIKNARLFNREIEVL